MKKTLSILLSIVMLLSITAGLDFSAYANDPEQAPSLPINGTYVNSTMTENDSTKFFKFTIPSDGEVTIKLMSYCDNTGISLCDEDLSNAEYLFCVHGTPNAPQSDSSYYNLSKGTYFLKVNPRNYSISTADLGKIKVLVSFKNFNTNETEPNDFNNPMLLQRNNVITGALTEQDEADWYKFTVTTDCYVTLNFTHFYRFGCVAWYNYDLSNVYWDEYYLLGGYGTEPTSETHTEKLTPGTYYVKVYQYSGGASTGKYTIKWSSSCVSHSYKTTVTPATAKANGKIVKKCSVCGAAATSSIAYPKTIALSTTSYTYDGKVKTPSVTVKDSKGKKISPNNYTVTYSSGRKNVGKYTVTIKFKGNYSGTVKKTFTIKPKTASISKLTAGKKKFTIKWKKQAAQTTGYQIQYSTSSKFKNAKTITVSKNKTTSKTISKLKAKKKYYVRIRTYKTVNGTKYYSSWSKAKSVTTKK